MGLGEHDPSVVESDSIRAGNIATRHRSCIDHAGTDSLCDRVSKPFLHPIERMARAPAVATFTTIMRHLDAIDSASGGCRTARLPIRVTFEFHSVGTSSSSAGDIPATFRVHTEPIDFAASPPSPRLGLIRGTRRAQRPPHGPGLQRVARALLSAPVRHLWPLQLAGYDQVPSTGPAILCPNHLSFFDSVFMMMTLDRPVYFIGKVEYLDSWKTRRLFPAMGMIPIDRESGTRAMVALDAATGALRDGALLCVFPEGSRSRDGRLHRGYPGAARLATSVDCPILPAASSAPTRSSHRVRGCHDRAWRVRSRSAHR